MAANHFACWLVKEAVLDCVLGDLLAGGVVDLDLGERAVVAAFGDFSRGDWLGSATLAVS